MEGTRMHSTLHTILHYVLLTICLILAFVLLLIFRTAYSHLLVPLAASGLMGNARASTLDKALLIVGALLFIVFFGVADYYLKKGTEQKELWGRFARLIGIEVFILLGLHIFIAIIAEFSVLAIMLLSTELIIGMIAIGYSFQVLPPGTGRFSQRIHRFFKQW
jgi:hypothetical protein